MSAKTNEQIIRDAVKRRFGHRHMTHICEEENLNELVEIVVHELRKAGRLARVTGGGIPVTPVEAGEQR
jgi:hypothetical protein